MKKACLTVGGVVWTMTYTLNPDNSINIVNFDSEDNDGYMFKHQLDVLDCVTESEGRIAESVSINGTLHPVANKQNVFTYKRPH